jgi:hypothetical protein
MNPTEDGWTSSESYKCSKVRILEYLPKLAIRNRPTVKSVVFKVKECGTLKERYDNSFGVETRACPEVLVEPLPKVGSVRINRG